MPMPPAQLVDGELVPAGPSSLAAPPEEKRGRKRGTSVPRWTPEEEQKLKRLVEEHGDKDWPTISSKLETNRSPAGVEQHWQIMNGKRKRTGPPKDEELDLPPDGEPDTEEKKAARMEAAAKLKLAREEEKRFKMEVASRKKEIRKAREGLPKKPVRIRPLSPSPAAHTPSRPPPRCRTPTLS